ncbi:MAG: hypothetical protein HUU55_03820 [Myxococcales bacterium]|nr:hypothetical protein [Myxococcales bacterium]
MTTRFLLHRCLVGCFVLFAPASILAWVPGDLDGSDDISVIDVQLAITLALAEISESALPVQLDANQDGVLDTLANIGDCGLGTVYDGLGSCTADPACSLPVNCNDNNFCTNDSCAPGVGCKHTQNTSACDDANPCTQGDVCLGGKCKSGTPTNCDDGNPCTADSCGVTMGCVSTFDPTACPGTPPPAGTLGPDGWPISNVYSWDGSWTPPASTFPLSGLFDNEYYDGHTTWNGTVSPILPPGVWDWNDANDDLANWKNFASTIGVFKKLMDSQNQHFGWMLLGNNPQAIPFAGPAAYFEGTPGTDILHLGPSGNINSFVTGNLGNGPDILVFDKSWSLDYRTGSTLTGSTYDNDLVIGGCQVAPSNNYTFEKTTIHTGPGRDWIFARNINGAAVDAGNGDNGKTAALDPKDGNDLIMLSGNVRDVRVFGGWGSDTVVWYMDDGNVPSIAFAGPNFFGGGGSGDALWSDPGKDRLVLVIPPGTKFVDKTPTPPGSLLFRIWSEDGDEIWWDEPVYNDPYARYCITCGKGPAGQKTMNLEYLSADSSFFTGWFWVTAFEELQIGVGPGAVVYTINQTLGTVTANPSAIPYVPPDWPWEWCQ